MGYFNTKEYLAERQQAVKKFMEASDEERIVVIEELAGPIQKQVERLMYPFAQGDLRWRSLKMPVMANGLDFNIHVEAVMVDTKTGQRLLMAIMILARDGQNATSPALIGAFQACLQAQGWVDFGFGRQMQAVGCYHDTLVQQ